MQDWTHKDTWRKTGENFVVEIEHRTVPKDENNYNKGNDRWNVYAYIYPDHWLFPKFSGKSIWQPATDCLPLHGGCTYLRYHYNSENECTSIQVGSDYNHDGDSCFTTFSTIEEARQVVEDAEALFLKLSGIESNLF